RHGPGGAAPSGRFAPSPPRLKTPAKVPQPERNRASRAGAARAAYAPTAKDCEEGRPTRRWRRPYARRPRKSMLSLSLSKAPESKADSQFSAGCVRLARMDEGQAIERLAALEIETPSWGYGNSDTRFHVYPWPGAARNAFERIDDAALVHRL